MLAHRAPKKFNLSPTILLGRFLPVTIHSYFFGLDSGGTKPATR